MRVTKIHDYADDDSTNTLQRISAITTEGCIVSEREYEYEDGDENSKTFGETLTGVEMILQVPELNLEDQVYRTLESLRETPAEELTLVEDE